MPHPAANDPNLVLLEDESTPPAFEELADGVSRVYRATWTYAYALRNAVGAGDKLPGGVLPYIDYDYNSPDAALMPEDFRHGIIDAGTVGP